MFLPTFHKHNSFLIFFLWYFSLFSLPALSLCNILLVCISCASWLHDLQQTVNLISIWFLLLVILLSWCIFFPLLVLLIECVAAQPESPSPLFLLRLLHVDFFLNEYQFCPSVHLGFQSVHFSYQTFISLGVSSGVLFLLLLLDLIHVAPVRGEVVFLLSFWEPGSSMTWRILKPW